MMGQREARAGALAILGCLLGAVVIVLLAWAFPARGDTPTDVGTGWTQGNPAGQVSGGLVALDDANLHDTPAANRLALKDNDVDLTPNPTCANAGTAGELTLLDVDESATDDWVLCIGTAQAFDIPDTGSDVVASGQLLIGQSTAGTALYLALSGDGSLDAAGALTVSDDSHAHTSSTVSGLDISADTNLAVTAPIVLTGDTLSCAAASGAQAGCLSSTDWTTFNGKLSSEVDGSTTNEIQNLFETINAPAGTDPVADSATDTLNLVASGIVSITGDNSTDTVTIGATEVDGSTTNEINTVTADSGGATTGLGITLAGGGIVSTARSGDTVTITGTEVDGSTTNELQNLFATIDTSSGTDPVADANADTLVLAGTAPITVTGDSAADSVTVAVSNATTGAVGVVQLAGDLAGTGTSPTVVDDSHAHTGATLSGIDIGDDTNLAAGAGLSLAGDTLATASLEAGFVADGGATSLTCGGSNQGKLQVLDGGALEWCDGAGTSVLRSTADFAAAGHSHTLAGDVDGDVGSTDLDEAAVEAELESVLDLADLQGAVTDAQVPDSITVTLAATATALAANGGNCSAGQYPLGVDASGAVESCTADDDVPEAADYSNLTAGTGITNSPTGTINSTLGVAIDTSEITDATIAQADADDTATLAGDPAFGASSVWFATTGLIFEGATSNASEGLLIAADVTADRTWTLPDTSGTVCTDGAVCSGYAASSHAHAASDVTSGTLAHERGGLEADVSAYAGLVRISGGATSAVTNLAGLNTALGSSIADGPHTTDTNASTLCTGTTTYLDGEGNCDNIASVYAPASHVHAGEDITSGTVADARIASTLTRDAEWDTAAEINAATTDDDFVTLTGTQTVSGNKTLSGNTTVSGRLIVAPGSTQAITAAGDAITVSAAFTYKGLTTVTGTTTLTSTPTIADGTATGQLLVLQNVDATATDCVKLQGEGTLTGSNLRLRSSTVTLCPVAGVPPSTLTLIFDGTEWVEPAPGTLRIREGTTEKGLLAQLDFDSADFDVTANAVALSASVSRLGNAIEKSEAAATFVHTDQANTWTTGAQLIQGGATLQVKKSDNTTNVINCGVDDVSRCETVDPASAQDVATKAYVDARRTFRLERWSNAFTLTALGGSRWYMNVGSGGLTTAVAANTNPGAVRQMIGEACTVVRLTACSINCPGGTCGSSGGAVPASATVTVGIRKEATDTNALTVALTSGTPCNTATGTTLALGNTDAFEMHVSCSGTCTDAANNYLRVAAICVQ